MSSQINHIADPIDFVELTPPTSWIRAQQETRRLFIVVGLTALLLGLCAMASTHVAAVVEAAYFHNSLAIQSYFLW